MSRSKVHFAWLPTVIILLGCTVQPEGELLWGDEPIARKPAKVFEEAKPKPGLFGRIVDNDGEPVTDAKLSLQGPDYLGSKTDGEGRFEFPRVGRAGEYRLRVISKKWVSITHYQDLPVLMIDPERPLEKNLTLARAGQVRIKVVDEEGEPVSASINYGVVTRESNRGTGNARTNPEGVAKIGGLAPSDTKYLFAATSGVHAPGYGIVEVTDPDEVYEHTIVLKKGKNVSGKVICKDGRPAVGWRVYAIPTWWKFGTHPQGSLISEDGSFEIANLADEKYNLYVLIPKGESISMSRVVMSGVDLLNMKQPIEVRLDYMSPSSMTYLTCRIRWIGQPVERGFRISGYSAELKHHFNHFVESDSKEVKVGPIPRGTYRIRPEHAAIEVMNLRKIKNLAELDRVKVPNDEPLQIVLRMRGKPHVKGVVVDAETKKPISKFQFRVTKLRTLEGPNYVQGDQWHLASSENGSFHSDVIGPGIYTVSVLADGYAVATSEQVNTIESPDEVLSIELVRGVTLRGKVVDDAGNPINQAKVRVLSLAKGAMAGVHDKFVTDKGAVHTVGGEFAITGLKPGYDVVRVDHPDFAWQAVHQAIAEKTDGEKSETLTIVLTKGATIRGQVFDQDGKPHANETLFFQDETGYSGGGDEEAGRFGTATTDDRGRYEIRHLPEAVVYVRRADPWQTMGVVRHAVLATDGETHVLNLGGVSRTDGRFFANGQPLAGARLQLGGRDSTFGAMKMYTRTKDDGEFTFFGAPPGHWSMYREIGRGEWTRVREVDIPAAGNLNIGDIKLKIGTLTVKCETSADHLPEDLRIELIAYNAEYLFGRDAATLIPRESNDAPFVFENVSPGDYELVCSSSQDFQVRERIRITNDDINTVHPVKLPNGTATITAEFRSKSGAIGGRLMLCSGDGRLIQYVSATTDDGGKTTRYVGKNLPAGKYVFRSGAGRNGPIVAEFEIADREEKSIRLMLSAKSDGYAAFNVSDASNVTIPVTMMISGEGSANVEQKLETIGSVIKGPIGKYKMRIDHPGFQPYETDIELTPGLKSGLGGKRIRLKPSTP